MRCGTRAALRTALQGVGLSGQLNTAFIERVNLTVRQGVAPLVRRTWSTAQAAPHVLAHLEWWRAYYHFTRPHASLRIGLPPTTTGTWWSAAAAALSATDASDGSRADESAVDSTGVAGNPPANEPGRRCLTAGHGWRDAGLGHEEGTLASPHGTARDSYDDQMRPKVAGNPGGWADRNYPPRLT